MTAEGDRPLRGPDRTDVDEQVRSGGESMVSTENRRNDPVRWSSVWAGLVVAIAGFVLIEMVFFAFGWLTLEQNPGTTAGWVTAAIGLVAFFIGGLVAGATSIWTGVREGVVHGVLVWALGVVSILFLGLFGGGALFGSAATVFAELGVMWQPNLSDADVDQALAAARDSAGWAVLGLATYLFAATVGGASGVKMGSGPRRGGPRMH